MMYLTSPVCFIPDQHLVMVSPLIAVKERSYSFKLDFFFPSYASVLNIAILDIEVKFGHGSN